MIIDCFPFFNELDILELRLNILNDCVDKFVLVEASKTQSLLDKPFYFEENKERFAPFLHKIVHVKVDEHPNVGGWAMENFQRNRISLGCESLNLQDEDIIAISDVDEIWNPNIAPHLQGFLDKYNCVSEAMRYFVFYLNLETVNKGWIGTVFCHNRNFTKVVPQYLRNMKDKVPCIDFPGWHFGYQGGKEKVYQKYLSCIEPLDKTKLPDFGEFCIEFDKRISDGGSFIFSDNLSDNSVKLKKVDIQKNLPEFVVKNLDRYSHLIYH